MGDGKSYSQRKRDQLNYRQEYFKHNPGIFGCIWTCAYCHKPLVGRHKVSVDHIMPLNSVMGRNARYNLVSSCQRCNLEKSDKVDYRVAKGYVSKLMEIVIFSVQKVIVIAIVAVWAVIQKAWSALKGALLLPFCKTSIKIKIIAVIGYVMVACYILSKF